MRIVSGPGEQSMQEHDYEAAADRSEECRAAINRARKDRGKNDKENGIKGGLARERTFVAKPQHDQCCNQDDDPAY